MPMEKAWSTKQYQGGAGPGLHSYKAWRGWSPAQVAGTEQSSLGELARLSSPHSYKASATFMVPFYGQKNWGTKQLHNWPRITHPGSGEAELWAQAFGLQSTKSPRTHHCLAQPPTPTTVRDSKAPVCFVVIFFWWPESQLDQITLLLLIKMIMMMLLVCLPGWLVVLLEWIHVWLWINAKHLRLHYLLLCLQESHDNRLLFLFYKDSNKTYADPKSRC